MLQVVESPTASTSHPILSHHVHVPACSSHHPVCSACLAASPPPQDRVLEGWSRGTVRNKRAQKDSENSHTNGFAWWIPQIRGQTLPTLRDPWMFGKGRLFRRKWPRPKQACFPLSPPCPIQLFQDAPLDLQVNQSMVLFRAVWRLELGFSRTRHPLWFFGGFGKTLSPPKHT